MGMLGSLCSIGFAIGVGLATAVTSNGGVLQERDSSCGSGPGWALPVFTIGGQGGTVSCETSYGNDYSPVSGMEVWRKGAGDKHGGRIAGMSRIRISFVKHFSPVDTVQVYNSHSKPTDLLADP